MKKKKTKLSKALVKQEGSFVRVTAFGPQFTDTKKTKKPKKRNKLFSIDPCNYNLQEIIDWALKTEIPLSNFQFDASCYHRCCECNNPCARDEHLLETSVSAWKIYDAKEKEKA